MPSDFDKQLKGIFNTVRSTINPDYAIPKDKAGEPMNVRIKRMKDATAELNSKLKELSTCLSAFTTNLNALTEEIQPYIAKESEVVETAGEEKPTTEAPVEEAAKDGAAPEAETKVDEEKK